MASSNEIGRSLPIDQTSMQGTVGVQASVDAQPSTVKPSIPASPDRTGLSVDGIPLRGARVPLPLIPSTKSDGVSGSETTGKVEVMKGMLPKISPAVQHDDPGKDLPGPDLKDQGVKIQVRHGDRSDSPARDTAPNAVQLPHTDRIIIGGPAPQMPKAISDKIPAATDSSSYPTDKVQPRVIVEPSVAAPSSIGIKGPEPTVVAREEISSPETLGQPAVTEHVQVGDRLPASFPRLYQNFFTAMLRGERVQPTKEQIDEAVEQQFSSRPLTPLTAEQEVALRVDVQKFFRENLFERNKWQELSKPTYLIPAANNHPGKYGGFSSPSHAYLFADKDIPWLKNQYEVLNLTREEMELLLTDPALYGAIRVGGDTLFTNGTRHLTLEQGGVVFPDGTVLNDTYKYTIAEFKSLLSQVRAVQGKSAEGKLLGLDIGGSNGLGAYDAEQLDPNLNVTNITIDPELAVWQLRGGHRLMLAEYMPEEFAEKFDIIFSNYAFEYFHYRDLAIENALRALSVGGIMDLSVTAGYQERGHQTREQMNEAMDRQFQRIEELEAEGTIALLPVRGRVDTISKQRGKWPDYPAVRIRLQKLESMLSEQQTQDTVTPDRPFIVVTSGVEYVGDTVKETDVSAIEYDIVEIGPGPSPAIVTSGSKFEQNSSLRYLAISPSRPDELGQEKRYKWLGIDSLDTDAADLSAIGEGAAGTVIMRSVFGEYAGGYMFDFNSEHEQLLENTFLGLHEAFRVLSVGGQIVIAEENVPQGPADPSVIGEELLEAGFTNIRIMPCQNMENPHWEVIRSQYWGLTDPPLDEKWGFVITADKPSVDPADFEEQEKTIWVSGDSGKLKKATKSYLFKKPEARTGEKMTIVTKDREIDMEDYSAWRDEVKRTHVWNHAMEKFFLD